MIDEIMAKIKAGLTGDTEHDVPYLGEQMEKYEKHELSEEIKTECGKLLVECFIQEGPPGLVIAGQLKPDELMTDVNFGFDENAYCGVDDIADSSPKASDEQGASKCTCGCSEETEYAYAYDDGKADKDGKAYGEEYEEGYGDGDADADGEADPDDFHVPGTAPYGPLEDTLNNCRDYIVYLLNDEKFEEATEACRKIIERLEERGMVKEDNEHVYMSFNEWFEDLLYNFHFKPEKPTALAPANYSQIYTEYASLLFKLGRYDEAEEALEKAMLWNPVDSELRLDHASILKMQGDLEGFFAYSCKALKFAFKPEQVGQGYRNIGSYFMEKEKFKEAAMCYSMSLIYDKAEVAYRNLSYLEEECGVDFTEISMEKGNEIAEKYGFPGLVDADVLSLMLTIGKKHYQANDYAPAIYMFELFYNLTGNEEIKEVLDSIKKVMAAELEKE